MRLGKVILGIVALALSGVVTSAQGTRVRFAFLTDLHYATDSPAVSDLRTCIRDLNTRNDLDFVLVGGDLTEFGSDEEIFGVKKMLDSLRCKYYVWPETMIPSGRKAVAHLRDVCTNASRLTVRGGGS